VNPDSFAPRSASLITCVGVRTVRVISRMDCCAKIGAMPAAAFCARRRARASRSPAVAVAETGVSPNGCGAF